MVGTPKSQEILTHKRPKSPKPKLKFIKTLTQIYQKSEIFQKYFEQRLADLDFADCIALLEGNHTQAQLQLDSPKINASKVGLEINKDKTEQMRLNLPANSNIPAPTINGEPIAVVNDFKYLGSYMSSSEKDVNNRITLAWVAFHKLKANIYALYQPKPSTSHKRGAPRRNYIDQISGYLCSDKQIKFTAEDIARYAKSRSDWREFVAAPNQPDR
jgi:hypothetical protein